MCVECALKLLERTFTLVTDAETGTVGEKAGSQLEML